MLQDVLHLPDGQNFTVSPTFGGFSFKSHELNTHPSPFPVGWRITINTTRNVANSNRMTDSDNEDGVFGRFDQPTLQDDSFFISSFSNPPTSEFKPAASPTRQMAMMLWITLYWYFHQKEPSPYLDTPASRGTPLEARPKGDWRVHIRREGVFSHGNLLPKLERMGLIASFESSVGAELTDGQGWDSMFVSKRMYWQIPGRLFLFTLQPNVKGSSMPGSPAGSRPSSPIPGTPNHLHHLSPRSHSNSPRHASPNHSDNDFAAPTSTPQTLVTAPSFPLGPFFSSSHLPTYYPPAPLAYVVTGNVRHPLRPKPPRMGEVFYTRFVPSVGQYLSLRVASLSENPVAYHGPISSNAAPVEHQEHFKALRRTCDRELLRSWLGKQRVATFWGSYEDNFLRNAAQSRHSFPAIGLWDGVPFGYFEIYWVKEDMLGEKLGSDADDFDRGLHILVGEEWARGRVPMWLSSLVHYCFTADYRTMSVCLEPRVDNARFLQHLEYTGFSKERQIAFPHKQSWFVRMKREAWEGPYL